MSIVDHQGEVEYPFTYQTVFNAIMEVAPNIDGLSLDSADEMSGHIAFKAGVSLASWGENIPVQLIKVAPTRTKMQILSTPKTGVMFGGAMDFGKNRQNIEKIINAVSAVLSNKPQEIEVKNNALSVSTADELLKLKNLKDCGVLSDQEFEIEKQKVLTNNNGAVDINWSNEPNKTQLSNKPMVHIEGSGSNPTNYALIALIVFVVISISNIMIVML